MKVIVIGANGFIGRYITRYWATKGYEVIAIARTKNGWSGDGTFIPWDGVHQGEWSKALDGADAVINLSGRSVNCRYNEKNKRDIIESRVLSTGAIASAISACQAPPALWLNASTATIYRHAEDSPQNESGDTQGDNFSMNVARAWEDALFHSATPAHTRKIALRISLVMANEPETVYDKLAGLTKKFLGGKMASGKQMVSWIHIEDLLSALDFMLENPHASGAYNITSPMPLTNVEMMKAFRENENVPLGLPATKWMLEIGAIFMKTETELILKSRWVIPGKLLAEGFTFKHPDMKSALADLKHRHGLVGFFS